jgi:hypothetical protein
VCATVLEAAAIATVHVGYIAVLHVSLPLRVAAQNRQLLAPRGPRVTRELPGLLGLRVNQEPWDCRERRAKRALPALPALRATRELPGPKAP